MSGPGSNPGPIAVLGSPPTLGNILVCIYGGNSSSNVAQTSGPTLTRIGSVQHAIFINGSQETWVNTYRRIVQAGDGQSYGFDNIGSSDILVAEFSGPSSAALPSSLAEQSEVAGATISIALGGDVATDAGFAAVTTRQQYNVGAAFTPNAATSVLRVNRFLLLYGAGNATLGGVMSGSTQDAYTIGYTAFDWRRRLA